MPLAINSLLQLIGELKQTLDQPEVPLHQSHQSNSDIHFFALLRVGGQGSPYILEARVARNVDGLDVGLYEEAIRIKHQFDAKLEHCRK